MYNKKIKTSASTNYFNKYTGIKRTLVITDMGLKRTLMAQPQISNPKQ
jgi:hypothetical protein